MTEVSHKPCPHCDSSDAIFGKILYCQKTGRFFNMNVGRFIGTVNKAGYLVANIDSKVYLLHRLAFYLMTGGWPKSQVDHINRDRTDNRWVNLRAVTTQEQSFNKSGWSGLGVKGIYECKNRNKKWCARVRAYGKLLHCSYHYTKEEALEAYRMAAKKHHGEFNCVEHKSSTLSDL